MRRHLQKTVVSVFGNRWLCLTLLLSMGAFRAEAQVSPEESLKTLRPANGLSVSLWASEPMVNNPTAMDIDSRGRVWIAEGLNYRMQQIQFDTLKRVADADRIKILTDSDGDGRADKVTVFADNIFPVPLGLAVEEIWQHGQQTGTRVYVGNSPDLLVLEDTDGDDIADRRFALLTGFRGIDSDHGLHGMTFGPDGKLYFTVGDARYGADNVQAREPTFDVTDRSGRRVSASNFGTTLQVNRDGRQLQVLSSGHRNNYEAAVDSFGNVFGSDNDDDGNRGCRMYWVMEGGEYGYQHPNSSRHWAEELPGIIPKLVGTGNGAPSGLCVYEGNLLPDEYFGAVLQIDSGTHQVNVHTLRRHGAGFRSDYSVVLKGDDDWFRPVDLSTAPDGSVFICDWYDAGVGANRFSDQTTGRIYRLSTKGDTHNSPTTFDPENPIEALRSPNTTVRLAAREILLSQGAQARNKLLTLFQSDRPTERARALHVLFDLPNTGTEDATTALSDSDPRIRETALHLLARDAADKVITPTAEPGSPEPSATAWLNRILPLADDDDGGVRRALLIEIRNAPTNEVGSTLRKLARSWDGRDRYYLEALRIALVSREPQFVQSLFDDLANQALETGWNNEPIAVPPYYPIGTNDAFLHPDDQLPPSNAASRVIGLAWGLQRPESLPALRRLLQHNQSSSVEQAATIALAAIEDPTAGKLLVERYRADAVDEARKREILQRLGAGVSGPWHGLTQDATLRKVFASALEDRALQADAIRAIARGKLTGFGNPLMTLASDESTDDHVRVAAISSLGKMKYEPVRKLATKYIEDVQGNPSGGPLSQASLDAIHSLDGDGAQAFLTQILVDSRMPLDLQRRSLQLVTTTAAGVDRVLTIHKEGRLPTDLDSELSFLLHNHADRSVRQIARQELPQKVKEGGQKIHAVQDVLALQGDASRGRELFQHHKEAACARCHRVDGMGALVGPDLASIGMKYGGQELLYHIQYPSGAINYSFVAHTFLLEDGRVLNGLVIDRKDGQVTIGVATGQHVTLMADEIEEERPQTLSLMPEGLVARLTPQQLSDLVEYLLTLRKGDAVSSQLK